MNLSFRLWMMTECITQEWQCIAGGFFKFGRLKAKQWVLKQGLTWKTNFHQLSNTDYYPQKKTNAVVRWWDTWGNVNGNTGRRRFSLLSLSSVWIRLKYFNVSVSVTAKIPEHAPTIKDALNIHKCAQAYSRQSIIIIERTVHSSVGPAVSFHSSY